MTDQDTFTGNFDGRDIVFRYPIPAQLMMLRRRTLRLQDRYNSTTDNQERMEIESALTIDTLDVVESLIVNKEDVEFLEQAMLHGRVDHIEVMDVLRAKREESKPAKKAAAKKTTANRGRTKR